MMQTIETKHIIAQRETASPEVFSFLINSKATKTCACIKDDAKRENCFKHYILKK